MTTRTAADADPFENDPLRVVADTDDAGTTRDDADEGLGELDIEDEPEEDEEDVEGGDAEADVDEDLGEPEPEAEPAMSPVQVENLKASINSAYMNVETRRLIAERDLEPVKAAKEQLERNLATLKEIKRQARQAKDRDRADEADDLIEQTTENLAAVGKKLEPLEKAVAEYDGKLGKLKEQWDELHAAPQAAAEPAQQTDWTKRNAWFKRDGTDPKSVYAKEVAKRLYEDGYTADKPALWRELDRQMKIKFADMRTAPAAPSKKAGSPTRPVKPGGSASSVTSGGGGSRAGAGKGKTTVPKGLLETWKKRGWDPKDLTNYAVKD